MIAVDTSALMAVAGNEPQGADCISALSSDHVLISAGTLAETLIVSARRNVGDAMERLIENLGFEVVPVTPASARRIAEAYARWGRGVDRAQLNFGDCFAYVLAKEHGCPLLYVGNDFAKTDIEGVL